MPGEAVAAAEVEEFKGSLGAGARRDVAVSVVLSSAVLPFSIIVAVFRNVVGPITEDQSIVDAKGEQVAKVTKSKNV